MQAVSIETLGLPQILRVRIGNANIFESSGQSGARTVYIDRDGGLFLKIAAGGSLRTAALMQMYYGQKGLGARVIDYLSQDNDYLVTAALPGEDGTAAQHCAEPERLSRVFGEALRALHETDVSDCPVKDRMAALLRESDAAAFRQSHLDMIDSYIGKASADRAAVEIETGRSLLQGDALIHGDYCLPNIMLMDWRFSGFIDVADGGIGERHYDLVWGLWTLCWNLKSQKYGSVFLDAYGRDRIDRDRLRICGLLAAME